MDAASWKAQDVAAFERALCEQVDAARAARGHGSGSGASRTAGPGVLAYLGEPVGWVAVEPRPAYPRVLSGRAIPATAQPDLSATRASGRSPVSWCASATGGGAALLRGAIDAARQGGARVVEAYPVDTVGERISSADLYHGPLSSFVAAGFTISGRPMEGRAVVEREL